MMTNPNSISKNVEDQLPAFSTPNSTLVRTLYQRWLVFARHYLACVSIARERRRLLALDERELKDIGVDRVDAVREANRDFWDIPERH